jgi:hypothetical protein
MMMGEAALEGSHISVVLCMIVDSHAKKNAETSLGAADTSVCATTCYHKSGGFPWVL